MITQGVFWWAWANTCTLTETARLTPLDTHASTTQWPADTPAAATAAVAACFLSLLHHSAAPYNMVTFSSYTDVSAVRCPDTAAGSVSPLNPAITNDILVRVNWLLNTFYNPQLSLSTTCTVPAGVTTPGYAGGRPTPAGTYSGITKQDMQSAVWTMTGALGCSCG